MKVTVIAVVFGELTTVPEADEKKSSNGKSKVESRPSRSKHCRDKTDYWEGSWRIEETCYHVCSCETQQFKPGVKNSNNNNE